MKYCILIDGTANGNKVSLFVMDSQSTNMPRLFDTKEEAETILPELKKDKFFIGARIEEYNV